MTFILIVKLIFISYLSTYYDYREPVKHEGEIFVVVMDAGSTGNRVNVYKFEKTPDQLVLTNSSTKKFYPGLSNFAKNLNNWSPLYNEIDKMIEFCKLCVPSAQRKSTPLILKATAGLRQIEKNAASKILAEISKKFALSQFLFEDKYVGMLSGGDEAFYAWMTVNYLKGRFNRGNKRPFLGSFDMGGGSAQVSFPVSPDTIIENTTEFKWDNIERKLYATSYVQNGLSTARFERLGVHDKCQKEGKECDSKVYKTVCLKKNLTIQLSYGPADINMTAEHIDNKKRADNCYKEAKSKLIADVRPIDNLNYPEEFFGMSNFYYPINTYRKLRNLSSDQQHIVTVDSYEAAMRDICSRPVGKIDGFYHEEFLCMDLTYIYAFLNDGLKINRDVKIMVGETIGEKFDVSWTIGLAVSFAKNFLNA